MGLDSQVRGIVGTRPGSDDEAISNLAETDEGRPMTNAGTEAERLLVVVAHPDDESFGCGSILARAQALGVTSTVCCATRGEAGTSDLADDRRALAALREGELRAAAALLGVERVVLFDWEDSDMDGPPAAGTLVAAPLQDVAAALVPVIDEVRPHIVVTLDASDGHRDHVHMRDATLMAVEQANWAVPRVYLWCLARSLMGAWVEHLRSIDPTSDYLHLGQLGTPDDEITCVLDASEHYEQRWEAIRLHCSQTSPYETLPAELQRSFLATDRLKRLRPACTGQDLEHELFTLGTPAVASVKTSP